MTLEEAIALQPAWIGIWLNWLVFAVFALPLTLLIWKQSRITAVVTFVLAVLGGFGVYWMHGQMGYVKLLGLPHIILWTPLAYYLFRQIKQNDMPQWPKRITMVVLATVLISLVFDYVDVARWLLGERTPFTG